MRIALNICATMIVGILIVSAMHSCNPFEYLADDGNVILKGGVQR